jgi:hypothetical protein
MGVRHSPLRGRSKGPCQRCRHSAAGQHEPAMLQLVELHPAPNEPSPRCRMQNTQMEGVSQQVVSHSTTGQLRANHIGVRIRVDREGIDRLWSLHHDASCALFTRLWQASVAKCNNRVGRNDGDVRIMAGRSNSCESQTAIARQRLPQHRIGPPRRPRPQTPARRTTLRRADKPGFASHVACLCWRAIRDLIGMYRAAYRSWTLTAPQECPAEDLVGQAPKVRCHLTSFDTVTKWSSRAARSCMPGVLVFR